MKETKCIKKFKELYRKDKVEFYKDIKSIENEINKNIIQNLTKKMNIIKLLECIINNFDSNYCDDSTNILRRKIISHSNRVYKNAILIMTNLELKYKMYFTDEDKFIMTISCMLHDIGKVYSDKNHNLYSVFITEYLLSMDERFNEELTTKILEVIYFHNKKNKYENKISLLAKIMRDADLFDEECGDSLFYLLLSQINNSKQNLNKLKIDEAKKVLRNKISDEHKDEIESKINTPGGKELYRQLLNEAMENFYMYIDYIEEYDDSEEYYNLKYADCFKIKIE